MVPKMMTPKVWKLLWQRYEVAQPTQLAIAPYAEIQAQLAVYLAAKDAKVEKYWMERV